MSRMSKTLVKTIKTINHSVALARCRLYNSDVWPDCFATISKILPEKKGGDTTYVVKVYEIYEQSF